MRFLPCAIASLLERLPFLLPGLSAGCASGLGSWLLPLAPPHWIPSFVFQVGLSLRLALGRRLAVWGELLPDF
jgi:hypothetical protein